ncbi:MAG: LA1599-like protein [uncultured bacterium]|nr:MAG: LA1599-like protein [uncultured bacterium]
MIKKYWNVFKEKGISGFIKLTALRFLTGVIALPIVIIFVMISPWVRIRLVRLFSYRIGHYALNTELFLSAMETDLYPTQKKYKTFFYTFPGEPICNQQLHIMWKRVIPILPFPLVWYQVDKFLKYIFGNEYKNDRLKKTFESSDGAIDQWNFLRDIKQCHISFTVEEKRRGEIELRNMGVPLGAPFVCLLGRDSHYLKTHLPSVDWSYQDYRDVKMNTYHETAVFLAEQGYYVIRMGKEAKEKFDVHHPKVIDYANYSTRSDFLDIYLSAHCSFFISLRSGIDAVAQIFRRPLLLVNFPLCDYWSLYFVELFIPKKVWDKRQNRFLTFSEMCWAMDRHDLPRVLKENDWYFVDNQASEILEAVKEMLTKMKGNWTSSVENKLLQEKFWQCIPKTTRNTAIAKIPVGKSFLEKHQALLGEEILYSS